MAIRAEESAWFDVAYWAAPARSDCSIPPVCRPPDRITASTLEATLQQQGFDPQPIRERRRLLDPSRIRAYLEVHIEQGPTLVARGLPAAVVSGIRGCKRFRNARCTGAYAHSGAVSTAPTGGMRSQRR